MCYLKFSHAHLLKYYLWLLSHYNSKIEKVHQKLIFQAQNIYCMSLHRRSLSTPYWKYGNDFAKFRFSLKLLEHFSAIFFLTSIYYIWAGGYWWESGGREELNIKTPNLPATYRIDSASLLFSQPGQLLFGLQELSLILSAWRSLTIHPVPTYY